MKKAILIVLLIVAGVIIYIVQNPVSAMQIKSSAFMENTEIPEKYSCDGENINPPLDISGVPEAAKSLVLIMDDPDAPNGTWVHWVKWNIDPGTIHIGDGVEPGGVSGNGSGGQNLYQGPCPPEGTHHYRFKVYALNTELGLEEGSYKEEIENEMRGHIIGQAELVGLYTKK
jgi:Raf kinase inhibitor-like YbhB/YbcL family protein